MKGGRNSGIWAHSLLKLSRSKFIRDLNRKVIGSWRVVRIVEYEPMAAKASQDQIDEGFEWEIMGLWRVVRIVEYETMAVEAVLEQIHKGFEW